jgi:hypothetical protein
MVKSIITEPINGDNLLTGTVAIRGFAYAGEAGISKVEVSVDGGQTWITAKLIGIEETYAWRHWEYLWDAQKKEHYTIMSRATDDRGRRQPENADWNVLGYGNNGTREHAIQLNID